jgi:hypothetical protein
MLQSYSQEPHDKMNTRLQCSPSYIFQEVAFEKIYLLPRKKTDVKANSGSTLNKTHSVSNCPTSATQEMCVRMR